MFIEKFEVKGYKRFLSKDIKTLTIDFKVALNLILGSNGSGKSSLMELLGGLPPDKKDFQKGGRVLWVAQYKGNQYSLTYKIGKAIDCEFLVNGKEQNPGHTAKVQQELILEHLNYSKEIHSLLTGIEKFTDMSPTRRREWFTRLSTVDMTYAIKVFNRARTKARDCKGGLRVLDGRIAQIEGKLAAHDLSDDSLKQIEKLTESINTMLRYVNRDTPDVDTATIELEDLYGELSDTLIRAKKLSTSYHEFQGATETKDATERLIVIDTTIANLQREIEVANKEQFEILKLKEQIVSSFKEDPDALEERIKLLNVRIDDYVLSDEFIFEGDVELMLQDTRSIADAFNGYIQTVPNDAYPGDDAESYKALTERLGVMRMDLHQHEKVISECQDILRHIDHTPEEECPKCSHRFHRNWTPQAIADIRTKLATSIEQADIIKLRLNEGQVEVEIWETYRTNVVQFREIKSSTPRLGELWNKITDAKLLDTTPTMAITLFNRWEMALLTHQDRHLDICERDRIQSIWTEITAMRRHSDAISMDAREEELGVTIVNCENGITELKREKEILKRHVMCLNEYTTAIKHIEVLSARIDGCKHKLFDAYGNKNLNYAIGEEQGKLAILRQHQSQYDSLTAIHKEQLESRESLVNEEKIWKLIVAGLSHESGLIAKQIKGHIGLFVAQMNQIVSKIWTYDLTVNTCSIASGDLDYRFPLTIPSKQRECKDVKYGSTGQRDVVNFAFRMVAMKYLGISGHPLFLDELGATFDSTHQDRLMRYLNLLLDTGSCSQMFVINHYMSFYGGLSNYECLVLDENNIVTPDVYNRHVTMK